MLSIKNYSASDLALFNQHISGVKMMLPAAKPLSSAKRRSLFKLNTAKLDFVRTSLEVMRQQQDKLPEFIDYQKCVQYWHVLDQYNEMLRQIEQLQTQLQDVKHLVGHQLLQQTKMYYHHCKTAATNGVEAYKPIYSTLKPLYAVGRNVQKK